MKYKRYIVFSWDEFDNSGSIVNPDKGDSFNTELEANQYCAERLYTYHDDFCSVFDCVERGFISKYCTSKHSDDYLADGYTCLFRKEG